MLATNCSSQLLRCKWKGRLQKCEDLFRPLPLPEGICCAFNYHALSSENSDEIHHTSSCGAQNGLTLLLNPEIDDYGGASSLFKGFEVFINDVATHPNERSSEKHFIPAQTEATLSITPSATYATEYLLSETIRVRRCYFKAERKLEFFKSYSQSNCLLECRSKRMYKKCGCVPWNWPKRDYWTFCDLNQAECVQNNRGMFTLTF